MKLFRDNDKSKLKSNRKQTFIGIWLHDDNLENIVKQKMELYLYQTFYYYRIFSNMEQFTAYIGERRFVAKIFFIISISDLSLECVINLAREHPKTVAVYVYLPVKVDIPTCFNTNNIEVLFGQVFKDINSLSHKRNQWTYVTNEIYSESKPIHISRMNTISISLSKFMAKLEKRTPIQHFTEEPITFLYFLIMMQILLRISHNSNQISDMWRVCRKLCEGNMTEIKKIDSIASDYDSCNAIQYYTTSSCLFSIVNQACQTENIRRIYEFRVYISDLSRRLKELDIQQNENGIKSSIKQVYRGKVLSGSVLQQLIDNEHGLISMNGFLSTTKCSEVSNMYAGIEQPVEEGHMSARFSFFINKMKQPYAYIRGCSVMPDEEEILFSLGTIWRIESITFHETFYQFDLVSYNNLDSSMETLLENYIENGCNLSSVGDVLMELGNYDEAEWFYERALKGAELSNETRGHIYYKMGMMRKELDDDSVALGYFNEAAELLKSSDQKLTEEESCSVIYKNDTESILIATYNNMAVLHNRNCGFEEAVQYLKQALEVENGPKLELAIVHHNLDVLYRLDNKYEQAGKHHVAAVELIKESRSSWTEFIKNLYRTNRHC